MDPLRTASDACSLARALAVVGDAYSALILHESARGVTRFDRLLTALGMAPNTLTQRLKALTRAGVLERRLYQDRPPRFEYLLTQAGRDYLPVLAAMIDWGHRHVAHSDLTGHNDPVGVHSHELGIDQGTETIDDFESRCWPSEARG